MTSSQRVPVTIHLSGVQYRLMTSMAIKRSTPEQPVQVHQLIERMVDRALLPMTDRQYERAHRDLSITQLHQLGLNDRAIARKVHCAPVTVFRTRHRLGLGPNDTRGGYHPHLEGAPDVSRN